MVRNSGIYKIQNNFNQKLYIGQTKDFRHRWHHHLASLRSNRHHCKSLQKDWNFYTEDAFNFSIVEEAPTEILIQLEKQYIQSYPRDRLYNFYIKNHIWLQEPAIIKNIVIKKDCEGVELPLVLCPNCNIEKLSSSFISSSLYCLECRQFVEDEFEAEDFILEGVRIPRIEAPVTKYKISP